MIESIGEVLVRRGRRWCVATDDPVLGPFLAPGGDYVFIADDAGLLDERNGGNLIAWRPRGTAIVLTHADGARSPRCEIDRAVLLEIVARLSASRRARIRTTAPARAEPHTPRARATRRAAT